MPDNPTPTPATPAPARRRRRWPLILGGLFILAVLLGGGGFVVASTLEDHDTFCIACHTVPETTYYNRAYVSLDNPSQAVTDLATAHYHLFQRDNKGAFACINCHRGDSGLVHRVSAITLGARDSFIFVTGGENATIEKTQTREEWLSNAACVSCHTDTILSVDGLDNHFHTLLPVVKDLLAQGKKPTFSDTTTVKDTTNQWVTPIVDAPLNCTSCHLAHVTVQNGAATVFMDTTHRAEACVSCHKTAKKGPQDPASLGE